MQLHLLVHANPNGTYKAWAATDLSSGGLLAVWGVWDAQRQAFQGAQATLSAKTRYAQKSQEKLRKGYTAGGLVNSAGINADSAIAGLGIPNAAVPQATAPEAVDQFEAAKTTAKAAVPASADVWKDLKEDPEQTKKPWHF